METACSMAQAASCRSRSRWRSWDGLAKGQTFYAVRKEGEELAFLDLIDPEHGVLWETEIPVRCSRYVSVFDRMKWRVQFSSIARTQSSSSVR
jgi:hypothetical protein